MRLASRGSCGGGSLLKGGVEERLYTQDPSMGTAQSSNQVPDDKDSAGEIDRPVEVVGAGVDGEGGETTAREREEGSPREDRKQEEANTRGARLSPSSSNRSISHLSLSSIPPSSVASLVFPPYIPPQQPVQQPPSTSTMSAGLGLEVVNIVNKLQVRQTAAQTSSSPSLTRCLFFRMSSQRSGAARRA